MSEEDQEESNNQEPSEQEAGSSSRFPEMDDLQNDIARRIRDNEKFLKHFLDKDYVDEDDDDDEDEDVFEEL